MYNFQCTIAYNYSQLLFYIQYSILFSLLFNFSTSTGCTIDFVDKGCAYACIFIVGENFVTVSNTGLSSYVV